MQNTKNLAKHNPLIWQVKLYKSEFKNHNQGLNFNIF